MYSGSLIREACQKGCSLPDYPYINSDIDCVVDDEPTTIHVLTKWNHTIVTASLDRVKKFHPCNWVPKARKTKGEGSSSVDNDKNRRHPPRCKSNNIRYEETKSSTGPTPDAGGSSLSRANNSLDASLPVEQLPKEYKTVSKWNSSVISEGKLVDETGKTRKGKGRSNNLDPIRQIYTYCVNNGCRYGCILTTGEAFIFRIKPHTARPGETFQVPDIKPYH